MTKTKITKLQDEDLNTSDNFYVCHNYKYENNDQTMYFKFYLSFPEGINTEYINIKEKEENKILEMVNGNGGKKNIYHFVFRYSDYIEVDPKQL